MIYASRNDREIERLCPAMQHKVNQVIDRCELVGLDFLIVSGLRTVKEQNALWRIGREIVGKIVTYVKGGDSMHQYGVAIDIVPVVLGFIQWGSAKKFEQIGKIAMEIGFEYPYPDWDKPHLQYNDGLNITALKAGKRPDGVKARKEREDDLTRRLELARAALGKWYVNPVRQFALRRFVRMLERKSAVV